jgi:hypothetical protein
MGVHLKFLQSPAIEAATLQSMYTTCILCIRLRYASKYTVYIIFTYMIIHAYVYPQSLACIITFARAQNFPHSDEQMRQELHLAASISA